MSFFAGKDQMVFVPGKNRVAFVPGKKRLVVGCCEPTSTFFGNDEFPI
jgi:hypothetical protein